MTWLRLRQQQWTRWWDEDRWSHDPRCRPTIILKNWNLTWLSLVTSWHQSTSRVHTRLCKYCNTHGRRTSTTLCRVRPLEKDKKTSRPPGWPSADEQSPGSGERSFAGHFFFFDILSFLLRDRTIILNFIYEHNFIFYKLLFLLHYK